MFFLIEYQPEMSYIRQDKYVFKVYTYHKTTLNRKHTHQIIKSKPLLSGTFHLRGLAFQLSGKNPSFALQNTFHLRRFFT
jgi:hypothetical protein